ncbi:MAG TPA: hypothetical protein VGJ71_13455 [Candidatus Limnocylindrales bacterium]
MAALAVVAWAVLLVLAASTTFRVDDWDLVANRSLADPGSLLVPFNEHLIAVPAAIFRAIYAVVGLHSYLPYLAVLLLLHLGVAVAVRATVAAVSGPGAALAAATVVLFLGSGYENLNAAFQIGQVAATLTGILAMWAVCVARRPGVAAGLALVAMACHAVGAAFLAGALVAQLLIDRRGARWFAIPIAVMAVWAVAYDLETFGHREEPISSAIDAIPGFVLAGPFAAAGSLAGLGIRGGLVVVTAAAALAIVTRARPAAPPLVAAAAVALATEYALIALSRASFGWQAAEWSRYVYTAAPLAILFAAGWAGRLPRLTGERRTRAAVIVAALTLVGVVGNLRVYLQSGDVTAQYVDRVRAAATIAQSFPDAGRLTSDPQMPDATRLRALFATAGSPAHDDLVPGVVRPVADAAADEACREMLPASADLAVCRAAVLEGVGPR